MPRLLVTEEPENGIHPRAIETVRAVAQHAVRLAGLGIHALADGARADGVCADMLATRLDADGSVSVVAGDKHPRLRDWRGTLDIGTLFAAGVLS